MYFFEKHLICLHEHTMGTVTRSRQAGLTEHRAHREHIEHPASRSSRKTSIPGGHRRVPNSPVLCIICYPPNWRGLLFFAHWKKETTKTTSLSSLVDTRPQIREHQLHANGPNPHTGRGFVQGMKCCSTG